MYIYNIMHLIRICHIMVDIINYTQLYTFTIKFLTQECLQYRHILGSDI